MTNGYMREDYISVGQVANFLYCPGSVLLNNVRLERFRNVKGSSTYIKQATKSHGKIIENIIESMVNRDNFQEFNVKRRITGVMGRVRTSEEIEHLAKRICNDDYVETYGIPIHGLRAINNDWGLIGDPDRCFTTNDGLIVEEIKLKYTPRSPYKISVDMVQAALYGVLIETADTILDTRHEIDFTHSKTVSKTTLNYLFDDDRKILDPIPQDRAKKIVSSAKEAIEKGTFSPPSKDYCNERECQKRDTCPAYKYDEEIDVNSDIQKSQFLTEIDDLMRQNNTNK